MPGPGVLVTVDTKFWCPSPLAAITDHLRDERGTTPMRKRRGDVIADHFGTGNPGLDGQGRLNGQATLALDEEIAGK